MTQIKLNIPKIRFKEFFGEWEEKIFGETIKLQRGSSPRPIVKYITNDIEGINWIKIGDTSKEDMFITKTVQKITYEGSKKSRYIKKGEIILSNSMSYGQTYILKIDGCIHDGWFVLREYEDKFYKDYLIQLLGSELVQKQYNRLAAGGVVNNISSVLVNSVKFHLPQLPEQQKIALFLSSVDEKIEKIKEKKKNIEEYKKGVMQKIFNREIKIKDENGEEFGEWEEKKLLEICSINKGTQLNKDELIENGLYPALNGGINPSGYTNEYNKGKNTITISEGGNSCGYVNFTKTNFWCGGHCYALEELKCNVSYLFQILKFSEDGIMRLRVGSGLPNIQKKEINNFKILFPSFLEQQKIANFLSGIDEKIENVSEELGKNEVFKKGLLQGMFV